ncbi:helix-turn-helix domain-containing protein [Paenibacillus aestuarii]|uniref:Helix-turn-helix domain-containing protein n=1 Tax=Paenibacillus aestuarii TaxID=516965 RepID=A0ABW0K1N6_9BACL|nr:transposase [Paenibacillus aestuarii]
MARGKYNVLEKLNILEEVSRGEIGFLAAAKKYEINKTTLVKWQRRYKHYGAEGLVSRTHNQSYTAELKLQAVKDMAAAHSLNLLCISLLTNIHIYRGKRLTKTVFYTARLDITQP